MEKETKIVLGSIATVLVPVLLAGNIFFVRRLVDEMDQTKRVVMKMFVRMNAIGSKLGFAEQEIQLIKTKETKKWTRN